MREHSAAGASQESRDASNHVLIRSSHNMKFNQEFETLLDSLLGNEASRYKDGLEGESLNWFRFNPLKYTPEFQESLLRREGFKARPVEGFSNIWSVPKAGRGERSIGKSLSHFLGNLYIQNLASMIPPILLDPQPDDRVLDMCAAPGSKTSMLASLMEGKGLLVANERAKRRMQSLIFNLRKCCVPNVLFFNQFGEHFGNLYYEQFDRVLVDPPCSALGTLGKNPEVLSWWTRARSATLANVQKSLLISGIKALRPGGLLVYSTCTITPEENEGVLDQVLEKYDLELEEIHLPGLKSRPALAEFGGKKFHPEVRKAIRIYPFESGTEGFFIACIRKTKRCGTPRLNRPPQLCQDQLDPPSHPRISEHLEGLEQRFGLDPEIFLEKAYKTGRELCWVNKEAFSFPCYMPLTSAGYPLADTRFGQAKLTTEGIHIIGNRVKTGNLELESLAELEDFVNRRDFDTGESDMEQVVLSFQGFPIGHGIINRGRLLSRFPRIGWGFQLTIDN